MRFVLRRRAPARLLLAALLGLAAAGCSRGTPGAYPDFADLVEQASPSVVNISAVSRGQPAAEAPAADDPALEQAPDWFKRFFEEHGGTPPPEPREAPGDEAQPLGSGFVLWEDGYILTNYHVVRDADEIIVRTLDRRQLSAQLVGSDERSDLALLKIDATDLPAVTLGDSSRLRPGQWVLAIGSPFGFDYSVSAGIVSAKGRNLPSEQYVPFIQTDVAINPGNSGGPLFDLQGRVVGVNSQIYSQNGGYQGVSFAIPIDVAAKVAQQLRDGGQVTRGWLGVVVQEVDRDLALKLGLDKPVGALVASVVDASPARDAGIQVGDVILRYNGEDLPTSSALPPMVGNTDPGQSATLDVLREGQRFTVKVEIGVLENQDTELALGKTDPALPRVKTLPLGIAVSPLSESQRRDEQVLAGGVRVDEVAGGAGARAGLRVGDILLQIAGQAIDSPERFAEVVGRLTPGVSVPMLVQRQGTPTFLPLDVPAAEVPAE
ncbi:MAG TPA: Do family serine endopeptidase [Nevskiaceae bacterium]|nr:Do family serine endopeptidase [Nevskiaceae bacterium]